MKLKQLCNKLKKNTNLIIILKGLAAIGLLTAVSAISVHYLTGSTLSEYAESNPEIAYSEKSNLEEDNLPEIEAIPNVNEVESEEQYGDSEFSEQDQNSEFDTTEQPDTVNQQITAISSPDVNIGPMVHFYTPLDTQESNERISYAEGFYYEPLTDEMLEYITGCSLPADQSNLAITADELRYLGIIYVDFNGINQAGELICNQKIAQDLIEIFYDLYEADYRFDKIVLIDNYGGDDTASMCADNTSCFNYRVVDNSSSLSNHAYGLAIDINPFYNPYVVFGAGEGGSDYISPAGSEIYTDRSASFPYKIDETDLCYRLFKEHGFKWGGDWNSCKDYQHFQKK